MIARFKDGVKWLAGQRAGHAEPVGLDRLVKNWAFEPSRPDYITAARRPALAKNTCPAPETAVIKPAFEHGTWAVYFIYAPDGTLSPAHRYTLRRWAAAEAKLLVVFSGPSRDDVPAELTAVADALYWKALPGFDFSGYSIALHQLAALSPGCDVMVMNDSVYGPFCDPDHLWALMRWDLTGFTASSSIENHIQSYAFLLRNWNKEKLSDLRAIFPRTFCFNSYEDVVFCQESRFARVAAATMTVGALWYAKHTRCLDASVYAALPLAGDGFPLIKRSLFTKHAHVNDAEALKSVLAAHGHPLP